MRAVLLKELLDRDAFFVGVEDGKDFAYPSYVDKP